MLELGMTIETFSKEFSFRHNFTSEDLDFLKNKFSSIDIGLVPDAWTLSLDSFLEETSNVKKIDQHFGFLVISWLDKPSKDDKALLKNLEDEIYVIDEDLHFLLGVTD